MQCNPQNSYYLSHYSRRLKHTEHGLLGEIGTTVSNEWITVQACCPRTQPGTALIALPVIQIRDRIAPLLLGQVQRVIGRLDQLFD